MSDVKVKGVVDHHGVKNFMITHVDSGEVHVALREGQKFILGEFKGTLAQCKQLVADNKVVHFADVHEEPEVPQTWDHVDPCALLVLLECPRSISEEVHRTLDANGWIKPDGTQDIELARSTFEQQRSSK